MDILGRGHPIDGIDNGKLVLLAKCATQENVLKIQRTNSMLGEVA